MGLGAHLFEALDRATPGNRGRKDRFASATRDRGHRGTSARPLYVTAVGIDERLAAAHVLAMHGDHRVPTLLRRVDQLARGLVWE